MGKLKVGDTVIDGVGKETHVLATYEQGVKDVYEITFNDGSVAECGLDHLWTVKQNNDKKESSWEDITLRDILKKHDIDYDYGKKYTGWKFHVPMTSVKGKHRKYLIDPYILGSLIADGYISGNNITLSCSDRDKFVVDRVEKLLPIGYKIKENRYPNCPQYHISRKTKIGSDHNVVKREIARLKLNVKSKEKFIPKEYLYGNSYEQRLELLKGLMDCDGSSIKRYTNYTTSSKKLAYDVKELVQSLGGNSWVKEYDRTHKDKGIDYHVVVNLNFAPFHLPRKISSWLPKYYNKGKKIMTKISLVRKEQSKCITVDSPTSQYLTNDYIVTHNTYTSAQLAVQLEERLGRPIRVLFLARQRQLIHQTIKYFPGKTIGIEMAKEKSNGEDVIFATVQSIIRRLDRFDPNEFDLILNDEAQDARGAEYETVIKYFTPAYSVGLSGTPFRLDGKKLTDGLFDKIVYQRNIKWGIENDFLCDVEAVRCHIGYDLSNVKTSGGDYNITQLEEAMIDTEHAIAEAYEKYSLGRPTLIFATGVAHALAIANLIDGAEVIIGDTNQEERDRIFNGFQNKEIPCIVSVQVMTQGVDLPISTVGIFAKPTKSVGRYQQQVGRILRKHPDKEKALIVDCIGSSNLGLCTAPSIIGIDIAKIPEKKQDELEGDLMDMIDLAEVLSDTPLSWIRNAKIVDIWAKDNKYKTNRVDYFQMPDGRMVVTLPERAKIVIPPPDMLGKVDATQITGLSKDFHEWGLEQYGDLWEYQRVLNAVRANLERNYQESASLWDKGKVSGWANKPPTDKQMKAINRKYKDDLPEDLTRYQATQIIKRMKMK